MLKTNLKTKYDGCVAKFLAICAVPIIGFVIWATATGEIKSSNSPSKIVQATPIPQNTIDTSTSLEPQDHQKIVENSAWDGAVPQVVEYLKRNLKDPDSAEWIEWSKVQTVSGQAHKYMVRCKYRAKNSFGGYDIANQIFYLDADGNVINVVDIG